MALESAGCWVHVVVHSSSRGRERSTTRVHVALRRRHEQVDKDIVALVRRESCSRHVHLGERSTAVAASYDARPHQLKSNVIIL